MKNNKLRKSPPNFCHYTFFNKKPFFCLSLDFLTGPKHNEMKLGYEMLEVRLKFS